MKWLDKAKTQESIYDHDWFNKQDDLFNARVVLSQAKGMSEYEAKCIAIELYLRDYDHLKEVHCMECQNLRGSFPLVDCGKSKPHQLETLHKCIGFKPLENPHE